jgi:hypothetical protein
MRRMEVMTNRQEDDVQACVDEVVALGLALLADRPQGGDVCGMRGNGASDRPPVRRVLHRRVGGRADERNPDETEEAKA